VLVVGRWHPYSGLEVGGGPGGAAHAVRFGTRFPIRARLHRSVFAAGRRSCKISPRNENDAERSGSGATDRNLGRRPSESSRLSHPSAYARASDCAKRSRACSAPRLSLASPLGWLESQRDRGRGAPERTRSNSVTSCSARTGAGSGCNTGSTSPSRDNSRIRGRSSASISAVAAARSLPAPTVRTSAAAARASCRRACPGSVSTEIARCRATRAAAAGGSAAATGNRSSSILGFRMSNTSSVLATSSGCIETCAFR
jgi:hypothetical protein